MLRGLYTAAAGMISQQRKHDTVTNNISNINTPGYKQVNAVSRSFPEMLISLVNGTQGSQATKVIGRLNTGVLAEEDPSIYLQGDLQETRNPFDLALTSDIRTPNLQFNGKGMAFGPDGERVFQRQAFFTVVNDAGEQRYSRNGSFAVNSDGQLVTPEGYRVLGADGQPLRLVDSASGAMIPDVKITGDGTFLDSINGQVLTNAAGQPLRVLISRADNPNSLIREGNGVYKVNPGDENKITALLDDANGNQNAELAAMVQNQELAVHQGYLERSNVDPAQSAIDMNTALRAYEANQKVIQFYDRSMDKAVNEVGRV